MRIFKNSIALALALCTSHIMAGPTINITGTIKTNDVNSVAIPDAAVSLAIAKLSTTSDAAGAYSFQASPVADVALKADQAQLLHGALVLNLKSPQKVQISVQNTLGQSQDFFSENLSQGIHEISLFKEMNQKLSQGVYVVQLTIGNQTQSFTIKNGQSGKIELEQNTLAQTLAVIDTIIVSKTNFNTQKTQISTYIGTFNIKLTSSIKLDQTITFGTLSAKTMADTNFTVTATSTSGMNVTFSSNTPTTCSVTDGVVSLLNIGTCTINALQAGNSKYNAAQQVQQSFNITKGNQTITFSTPSSKSLGDPAFDPGATASSKLAIVYTSSTQSVCTASGNLVTLLSTGTCTVTATQPGNANFNAATSITKSFTVATASADACGKTISGLTNWFTKACYEKLFPKRTQSKCVADGNSIYTYENFMAAAATWPKFGSEGTITQQKKDVAAFFAHVNQETGGGNPDTAWALCWVYERAAMPSKTLSTYDQASWAGSPYQPVAGQHYFGRGPMQLSWPANYGWFSNDILGDMNILLNNPDKVATDGIIAFKAALWFWNQKQDDWVSPLPPTLHDIIVNGSSYTNWSGFGATTKVINGALECSQGNQAMTTRGNYYVSYQKNLQIPTAELDQTNRYCNSTSSY